MSVKIYWSKVKPTAKIPCKNFEDAGYDIYPCFSEEYIKINPHDTKMIPTGLTSMCPPNYCFVLKERGSTGTKGIALRSGIIDSGYRGEWFVTITNTTEKTLFIAKKESLCRIGDEYSIVHPYEKAICQALLIPVPKTTVQEIDYKHLLEFETHRGTQCLGSSGK